VPAIKIFIFEERSITPYSVLLTKGTTTEGTKEVSEILDKDCSKMRPKPTRLIKTLIQLADKGKDLTVLDFFAGTGTTGHALLKYAMDIKEKEAKFILCTNDDEGICTEYCYPRTYKVMKTGYKNKDGKKLNHSLEI
jgi:adenine-specific DNA-methyltransferase